MRRCVLLLALALVACGGPDRETFVRDANAACRDRAAGQEALGAVDQDEMLPAVTVLYEQELARLRALEPTDEDAARHADWVRASEAVAAAWRDYSTDASDRAARTRVLERFQRAPPGLRASWASASATPEPKEGQALFRSGRAPSAATSRPRDRRGARTRRPAASTR